MQKYEKLHNVLSKSKGNRETACVFQFFVVLACCDRFSMCTASTGCESQMRIENGQAIYVADEFLVS